MKKLIFILFLFMSAVAFGQTGETKPSTAKVLQTPNNATWWFNPPDTTLRVSMGIYGILNLATQKHLKHKIDSLAYIMNHDTLVYDVAPYYIEVTTDGVTTYSIPFTLRTKSQVWVNGALIRPTLWTGTGTTSLTVDVDTRKQDYLIIKK